MKTSHDEYLKFTEQGVLDQVMQFHAKGNYTIHKATRHISTLHQIPTQRLKNLTGNELQLNATQDVPNEPLQSLSPLPKGHILHRQDSCENFERKLLSFEMVCALLSPLLAKGDTAYKRGYPSAGALYPVEVFCVDLNGGISNWPSTSRVLHLLADSRTFEVHHPSIDAETLATAIIPEGSMIGQPSLAILYAVYLPKAIFKYRYRGYRHALMEVGSMYMLTDLRCKELRLESRPWSGFTDHQVTSLLNLNPALFLTACTQLIG